MKISNKVHFSIKANGGYRRLSHTLDLYSPGDLLNSSPDYYLDRRMVAQLLNTLVAMSIT